MFLPARYAHLEGELLAFRARLEATKNMSEEELLRSLRAKQARQQQQAAAQAGPRPERRPPAREARPAPEPSRQYAKGIATAVARDHRLTKGAGDLAILLVALAGRDGFVDLTKGHLAARLGRSERTIQRWLGDLRELGYIGTLQLVNGRGATTGLRIWLLPRLLPYWQQGATKLSPLQSLIMNRRRAGTCKSSQIEGWPRYRRQKSYPKRPSRAGA